MSAPVAATTIREGRKFTQYLAAFFATLSATVVGTYLSWTSPTFPLLKAEGFLTGEQGSWVGSLFTIGAFIGALPAGIVVNAVGRKYTLLLIMVPVIVSWALIYLKSSVLGLYFGRSIGGLCAGILSVAGPLYISEIAENSVRGTLGTFYQLQLTVGILFTYLVGLTEDVYTISLLCAVIPFVFVVTFIWMPESPVFLLSRGREEDAVNSLTWFRGSDYQIEPEINQMKEALLEATKSETTLSSALKEYVTRKALFISLGLMLFQQLSGINAVIFYSGDIFESAGSTLSGNACSIIVGVVQVVATYSSSLLIEKAGRRFLLILSDSVMAICLALIGFYFHQKTNGNDVSSISWLPLASLTVFIVVFSLGFGPIPWIIMGELFPNNLKNISSALAAGASWLLAFVVTKYFAGLVTTFGLGITFWIFAVICCIGAIFVAVLLPETKGKDINTILLELAGEDPSNIQLENVKSHL